MRLPWMAGATIGLVVFACLTGCASPHPKQISAASAQAARGDWAKLDILCMGDAGFASEQEWDGSIVGVDIHNKAEAEAWVAAADSCGNSTGYYQPNLTPTQISEVFHQEVAEHDCLAKLGFPGQLPPSEKEFASSWGSDDQYSAYDAAGIQKTDSVESKKVVLECPPPMWFLDVEDS